jgi:hypothetical protein
MSQSIERRIELRQKSIRRVFLGGIVVELKNNEEIDLIQKMNGSTRNWEMIDQKNEMMP